MARRNAASSDSIKQSNTILESLHQGLAFHQQGQVEKAKEVYESILKIQPDNFDALQLLASLLQMVGNNLMAIALFDQAIKLKKTYAPVFSNRGNALKELKRFDEALLSYDQAIALKPDFTEAFTNRGATLHALQRFDEAVRSYDQALALTPNYAEAYSNRAIALHELKRFDEAVLSCNQAIALKPHFAEAYSNRGNALRELKRFDEALLSYDQAIALKPNFVEAHSNHGATLQELKRLDEALMSYGKAIALKPDYAKAYFNRAAILQELKRLDEALTDYDAVLALRPNDADAYSNRGAILHQLKRFDESLASYSQVVHLKPHDAEAYSNQGALLQELKRGNEALKSYAKAIALKPDYAEVLSNQALTLQDLNRLNEALLSCDQAISIKPNFAQAYSNRGNILKDLHRFDEARANYDQAIALNPDYAEAYFNKSLIEILTGNYSEGWFLHEWRIKEQKKKAFYYNFNSLVWRGEESIQGKRVFIHHEQGLGDSIQFCRYIALVKSLGASIILEVPKPLVSFISSMACEMQVISNGMPIPEFDAFCPIMSLPYAFKTSIETIPFHTPYLFADIEKVKRWQNKLGESSLPRVGLVWSGHQDHKNDHNRSVKLQDLLTCMDLPIEWHSVQKEYRTHEIEILNQHPEINQHQEDLNDFSDTAAFIECMDLVISVDTSVAHAAGAIGKPVWILLPYIPDYRWLLEREDSPWYPNATLFRQNENRSWVDVIHRVKEHLAEHFQFE